ncbi:sugar-binding protein [Mesorhizobium sp. NBSH29]|uniref:RHS repeat protein n=1 Tax=Mesorhizobium sp. NBSH29 TaxID=2654249 RepID=UPI0018965C79|nr:RHS repeat protein [Mesorhizobium sp. NBSH29]QPC85591.1 sugar-binding protein [Mesorhizobium sp. NBSH29]
MSFVQQGVDPRTGQYTVQLLLPELSANELAGPSLPLSLSFNPLNGVDAGFGLGFGLGLSQYNPQTRMLSLGDGETFKVTGNGLEPAIAERKLKSFRFFDDGGGIYRIIQHSGVMETLITGGGGIARPVEIAAPSGHTLKLSYLPFADSVRLESIRDEQGEILRFERDVSGQWLELLLWPNRGEGGMPVSRYTLRLDALSRVSEIVLPTDERASWRFDYVETGGLSCINEIFTPVGGRETVLYEDGGHPFPVGSGREPLPRVSLHRLEPGFGQPPIETRYSYSDHNFLGHGAAIGWSDDGLDNLYKVTRGYAYSSTAQVWGGGEMKRKTERTFNRFHLLNEEVTTQGNCVKRVKTTYYADLPENIARPFDQQPPQCQLPAKTETIWELTDEPTRLRAEIVETTYDVHGNLLIQKNANGTSEERDYYPVQGEGQDCPPDPDGFVRSLRSSTVHPDESAEVGGAPTLRTHVRYGQFTPLPGEHARPFLLPVSETLLRVEASTQTELQRSESAYYDDPTDPFKLARLKSESQALKDKTTRTNYVYTKLNSPLLSGETVLQTLEVITGFDGVQKSITQQSSLLNGQPLLVEDVNQVRIRYAYDELQRVTSETVAPGTDYEATRTYQYALIANTSEAVERRRHHLAQDEMLLAKRDMLTRQKKRIADLRQAQPIAVAAIDDALAATQMALGINFHAQRLNGQAEQVMTDVKGVATRTFLDGLNRPVLEERQDPDNTPINPPFRQTYLATYDDLGYLVAETVVDWIGGEDLLLTSTHQYDNWGTKNKTTHPNKVSECEELDPIGAGGLAGPVSRQWREGVDGQKAAVTETSMNLFGDPIRTERFDTDGGSLGMHRRLYDGLGRMQEEYDPGDLKTSHRYDDFDRPSQTTLPDASTILRWYAQHSSRDLPVSINVNGVVLGTQDFDGLDRLVQSVAGGRQTKFRYDPGMVQPAATTTPNGQTIEYSYVPHLGDEPVQRRSPNSTADYEYDPRDARLVSCLEAGEALNRTYSSTGRLRSETTRKPSGEEFTATYDYSLLGRECSFKNVFRPCGRI